MYLPNTSVNCDTSLNGGQKKIGTDTRWKLYFRDSKLKQTENDDKILKVHHGYLFLACAQTFSFFFTIWWERLRSPDKSPAVSVYMHVLNDR